MALSPQEHADLAAAKRVLENPGLTARISNLIGTPVESGLKKLTGPVQNAIGTATRKAVEKALEVALLTIQQNHQETAPSNHWHTLAAGLSGAAGGAFGLPALALELPLSTTIILRSIADIARSQGEDLNQPDARLHCVQVLALGGVSRQDDLSETGYFATRAALARVVSEAARHVAHQGLSQQGAPALVRLITQVTSRFSVVVSEKVAAQAVPVVGALGGAAINTLFMRHYQDMGHGHFTIRRLERLHGQNEVRRVYDLLPGKQS